MSKEIEKQDKEAMSAAGKALSKKGAAKGGRARASVLTPEERKAIARQAAAKRWGSKKDEGQASSSLDQSSQQASSSLDQPSKKRNLDLPIALFPGTLTIGNQEVACYVLNNEMRVIAQREVVRLLTGHAKGILDRYLDAQNLQDYVSSEKIIGQAVRFMIPGTRQIGFGYEATLLLDICDAYLRAREDGKLQDSQQHLAKQAEIITRACAKVGIIALIDEATGYEKYKKKRDLQVKLQAFIAEEMQEWAIMFPEEFWYELARLEGVRYSPRNRPLRWGRYVMMFVYDAIDSDVGQKLREINPDPHFLKNHHQWLKDFGREKVNNQIQQVIAVMKLCNDMDDFRKKFARAFKKTWQTSFDEIDWTADKAPSMD